jgi:UDP-N-acetylmuramate dehydrogenase|tara:strand:- start:2936 stop:3844 length:909 start_codon:yes stop_codon:yes gene_type:complete
MDNKKLVDKFKKFSDSIYFNYSLKKLNWLNIGGNTKIFFKPKTLQDLLEFLKINKENKNFFVIGAGSNVLFKDDIFEGVIIKLSKNFSRISMLNENTIVAGSGVLDKALSKFALENSLSGFEFLSCIPGSIGGGIRMNSGCFGREFKDILISVQAVSKSGKVLTIPSKDIVFGYRSCNLPKDLIFLSASFKGSRKNKKNIEKEINNLITKKETAQPTRVKTGGSTFKNPIKETNKKVWKIIKESVPNDIQFGDAIISDKHSNFFVNKGNASYKDMKKLIDYVKESVKNKTGIMLDLEIILVE